MSSANYTVMVWRVGDAVCWRCCVSHATWMLRNRNVICVCVNEYVSIRQHTSAYVSRRQQTCDGGGVWGHQSALCGERFCPVMLKKRSGRMSAYVSIRQHTSACVQIRQHTSKYVSIRQHTSAYVQIRQHMPAYLRIRQQTSAYVSIRQHTSAYVSIRRYTHLGEVRLLLFSFRGVFAHVLSFSSPPSSLSLKTRTLRQLSSWLHVPHRHDLHTSAYVSIRQHTSTYVNIRQHGITTCVWSPKMFVHFLILIIDVFDIGWWWCQSVLSRCRQLRPWPGQSQRDIWKTR